MAFESYRIDKMLNLEETIAASLFDGKDRKSVV